MRNTDEIQNFYLKSMAQTPLYNTLYLNTVFTKKCNFNCSYCFQDKTDEILDLNVFENILKKLLKFKNIDKYIFSIMGGELSLLDAKYINNIFNIFNKEFKELKKLKKDIKIVFVTNFSTDFKNIYELYFSKDFLSKNVLLDLAISHHHQNENQLFNKAINDFIDHKLLLQENILFTIKTFNINSYEKFINLKNEFFKKHKKYQNDFLIEFGDKNWKIQKRIFAKIKKFTRPVICNSWNYNLDSNGKLYHLCNLKEIDINEIKQIPIFCNKRCSNYEIEQDTYKRHIQK